MQSPDVMKHEVTGEGDFQLAVIAENYDPMWRMSEEAILALCEILEVFKPRRIFEAGTGYSSVFLYDYAADPRHTWPVEYYAVDEDNEFLEKHKKLMSNLGMDVRNIFTVPKCERGQFYDRSKIKLPEGWKADLIIVDGPQEVHCEGRINDEAVEFYDSISRPRTIWLIDDTHIPPVAFFADKIYKTVRGLRAFDIMDQTEWKTSAGQSYRRHSAGLIPQELIDVKQLRKVVRQRVKR